MCVAAAGLTGSVTYAACRGSAAIRWCIPTTTNFAPRVGFAWTPWSDRKTVFAAATESSIRASLLNPFRNSLQNTFPVCADGNLHAHGEPARPGHAEQSVPGERLGWAAAPPPAPASTINAPTGYQQSWNLTIERDLGGGMALEIGYAGIERHAPGPAKGHQPAAPEHATYLAGIGAVNLRPFPLLQRAINQFQFGVQLDLQCRPDFPAQARARRHVLPAELHLQQIDRRCLAAQRDVGRRAAGGAQDINNLRRIAAARTGIAATW